jgi:heme oxygenase
MDGRQFVSSVEVPLSLKLRQGTRQEHRAVEALSFIRSFLRGVVDRSSYLRMLVDLHHVYTNLEELLGSLDSGAALLSLYPPTLWRAEALAHDVAYYRADPALSRSAPSRSALHYGEYLQRLGREQPLLLLAHAYTRYLGDLSGGQILRRIAARALGVSGPQGLAFYDFPAIPDLAAFKQQFRDRLDALALGPEAQSRLVSEARHAFALSGAIYGELTGNSWSGLRNLLRARRPATHPN